ncbi:uncharacterized protein LOC135497109 [Lineus longissimus]|uniref:uncharacterized protein LOC135497109 n=1 Tax=Lineus longissimus TaxID=88925 RepID=UPI00315DD57F
MGEIFGLKPTTQTLLIAILGSIASIAFVIIIMFAIYQCHRLCKEAGERRRDRVRVVIPPLNREPSIFVEAAPSISREMKTEPPPPYPLDVENNSLFLPSFDHRSRYRSPPPPYDAVSGTRLSTSTHGAVDNSNMPGSG